MYTKIHKSESAAENHIEKIKARGGQVKVARKNGKITLKYSFEPEYGDLIEVPIRMTASERKALKQSQGQFSLDLNNVATVKVISDLLKKQGFEFKGKRGSYYGSDTWYYPYVLKKFPSGRFYRLADHGTELDTGSGQSKNQIVLEDWAGEK